MDTSTTTTETFARTIEEQLKDTPYMLERTATGFNVTLNLADAKWWMLLSRNELKDAFEYQVTTDEATKSYSINDVRRRIAWKAGVGAGDLVPYFDLNYKYQSGEISGYSREIKIGVTDKAEIKKVVDINFSPAEKKKLINDVAASLGWKSKMSSNKKIGIAVAAGAGVLVVVILIAMAISLLSK